MMLSDNNNNNLRQRQKQTLLPRKVVAAGAFLLNFWTNYNDCGSRESFLPKNMW